MLRERDSKVTVAHFRCNPGRSFIRSCRWRDSPRFVPSAERVHQMQAPGPLVALVATVLLSTHVTTVTRSSPQLVLRVGTPHRITILSGATHWPSGASISLAGSVVVGRDALLEIDAGVEVTAAPGTSITVTRDGRIDVNGTVNQPVVLTCQTATSRPGCWDGLVILGNAPINHGARTSPATPRGGQGGCREAAVDSAAYGGCAANDSSGALRYVRIQYATHGLRVFGVGSRTVLQDIQVHCSAGHGLEVVGGAAQFRRVALTTNAQYGLVYSGGWTGQAQFVVIQQDATGYAGGVLGRNALGASGDQDAIPRSAPILANLTIVAPPSAPGNPFAAASPAALRFERGAAGRLFNVLLVQPAIGIDVDETSTCAQVLSFALVMRGLGILAPVASADPDSDPPNCAGQGESALLSGATTITGVAATTQLVSALDVVLPDFRPVTGSAISLATGVAPPASGILESVSYLGAVSRTPNVASIPWYAGWTIGEQLAPTPVVTLMGRVSAPGRNGIAGVGVQVLPAGGSAVSDALGNFTISGVPAGPVEISIVSGLPTECEAPPIVRAVAFGTAMTLADAMLICGATSVALTTFGAVTLSGSRGVTVTAPGRYAVLPQFAATQDFASGSQRSVVPLFPYTIGGTAAVSAGAAPATVSAASSQRVSASVVDEFHMRLRAIERAEAPRAAAYMQQLRSKASTGPRVRSLSEPATRTFSVLASLAGSPYISVPSRLVYDGTNIALYVDVQPVAAATFSDADYAALGRQFDADMFPVAVSAFGPTSDIDANGKTLVLFTPVVNRLTLATGICGAYVAGYFNGTDLSGSSPGNRAEVFYASVPGEPAGGPTCTPLSIESVRRTAPSTFIHELQHLISYNQHVLVRGRSTEEVWLNEGLSHLSEELGGKVYEARYPCPNYPTCPSAGRSTPSQLFPDSTQGFTGNFRNAFEFFATRTNLSLTSPTGFASIEERGAAWLFLRWIADQKGESILPQFVQTVNTGTGNIEAVTGERFTVLFADFLTATLLDDYPSATAGQITSRLQFPSRNLRQIYGRLHEVSPTVYPTPYLLDLTNAPPENRLTGTSAISTRQMKPGTFDLFQFTSAVQGEGVSFAPANGVFPSAQNAQVTVVRLP